MSEKTVPSDTIGRHAVGYMVNTVFSHENTELIADLQAGFTGEFGNLIWSAPPETLHSTLLDWIAPFVDYGEDKDILYQRLAPRYDDIFRDILSGCKRVNVRFDTIRVTPNAVILVGTDDGTIQHIRDAFVERATLLPNTKQPPTIIHTTICRFTGERALQPIIDHAADRSIDLTHEVAGFRLVRETISPQLAHTLVKEYALTG